MGRTHCIILCLLIMTTTVSGSGVLLKGHAGDQHGEEHDLASLAQGSLVVDFAASWCEPCYEALPRLEALAQAHPEVRFVVLSVDETKAGRDRLVQDLGLELPVLWDEGQKFIEEFAPEGFPATYVFYEGQVIYQHIGADLENWQALVAVVDRLQH